ncbi:MAG: hypothetical protein KC457_18440, partial [Myxococcales bacterium]|nr:hypothetical protein [Myxococcales bacterium]
DTTTCPAELSAEECAKLKQTIKRTQQQGDQAKDKPKPTAADLESPPFVSYSAWPRYRIITLRQRAELTGICEFVEVDPPGIARSALPQEVDSANDPSHARMACDSLSEMRRLVSERADLRVVLGGKIRGWNGWLPGIAEEVMCTLQAGNLPLVLGGFSGCAALIARYLKDPKAPWPDEFSFETACEDPRFVARIDDEEAARRRFVTLHDTLEGFRKQLHGETPWVHRIGTEQILALLEPRGAATTLNLVQAALDEMQ